MNMSVARRDVAIRVTFFVWTFIVGAAICIGAVKDYAHARASQSWPTVQGVVIEAADDAISYAYSWNARTYHSSRIHFVTGTQFGIETKQKWQAGDFIKVYVSPTQHDLSVIEPGGIRSIFALFLTCGAVFAFVGGGGLAVSMTPPRIDHGDDLTGGEHQHSYSD